MARIPSARLTVRPGPVSGSFRPPGDKSITHRAYLLGLIARGETRVERPNPGADCEATLRCVEMLGGTVTRDAGGVTLVGRAGSLRPPEGGLPHRFDCGNSGTALRLLVGVLAAQPFASILDGDASLRRRPMARVIAPLQAMGARITAGEGARPPLHVEGALLRPMDHVSEVASAQVASCVLLAGLFAEGRTSITLPRPARDHTERMLAAFGVPVTTTTSAGGVTLAVTGRAAPTATAVGVPGDFSAAAFFLAAAAATPGTSVTVRDVNLNSTRTGLLAVLERMGAAVSRARVREESGEPVGDVTVTGPERLRATAIAPEEVPALIDEIPAWTIAASAAHGTSRVRGAAELRVKESDRLRMLAECLGGQGFGLAVEESPDGLAVTGGPIRGASVRADDDHRIAMAMALIGTRASGPVTIEEAGGIPTSFPDFAATLAALGGVMEEQAMAEGR